MSSLFTESTRVLALPGVADQARATAGIVAIAALLVVLVLREAGRAELDGVRARRVEHLRFVTLPLILVFAAVVIPRIVGLLT
ncbi:MAG: hypothetical protein QOJ29_752 [Thermoleophilaceae bacterium]|nr:hypothetical protein [Thermoleophilaceae bacterium]